MPRKKTALRKAAKNAARKAVPVNVPLRVNPTELRRIWHSLGRTISALADDINLESADELEELAESIRLEARVRTLHERHFGPIEVLAD